jgi:hypothetical protein
MALLFGTSCPPCHSRRLGGFSKSWSIEPDGASPRVASFHESIAFYLKNVKIIIAENRF